MIPDQHSEPGTEIARNVVESQRLSTLIDYATAAPSSAAPSSFPPSSVVPGLGPILAAGFPRVRFYATGPRLGFTHASRFCRIWILRSENSSMVRFSGWFRLVQPGQRSRSGMETIQEAGRSGGGW